MQIPRRVGGKSRRKTWRSIKKDQGELLQYPRNEIAEQHICLNLAKQVNSPESARVLEQVAADEKKHYDV